MARCRPLKVHSVRALMRCRYTRAPNIDRGKQEQPDDINEVPVPGRGFETKMMFLCEVAFHCTSKTDRQENGSDDHMETVKAGGHEERGAINVAGKTERSVRIFVRYSAKASESLETTACCSVDTVVGFHRCFSPV